MFQKILIANRGEIACRVVKTARRMGVQTVAVFSEADAHALHVRLADEAVFIGPAPARESYLAGERIIAAAHRTGAQAIHPGYGFLSENEAFAAACARERIVFIGPSPDAIRTMGSKSAAKAVMEKAGVPLTPGYHGDNQAPAFLHEQAERVGYPVLIKASAGGGGKGMRLVEKSADFDAAVRSCKREAAASFGDDRVLLEEYVIRPRHIEIQVFGDSYGGCVHLFERDCSVQRRHQKVMEEAPAPGMTPDRRAAMGAAAVAAAKAVGYVGAGTVEFIVRQDGSFYFMEMNTRLQVEHPVTEMITGVDLVEWQLRVAAGEPLPLQQSELRIRGHALEARIYAEDPARGFLPSTGKLSYLSLPATSSHVRVDTGVEEGDEIGPHYDPMIAKLIVWDENRDLARARMLEALTEYRVVGVASNIEFLARLTACPAFANADLDTGLIEREKDCLFPAPSAPALEVWYVAAFAELLREAGQGAARSPWHIRDGWRLNAGARRTLQFRWGEQQMSVLATPRDMGYVLTVDGRAVYARGELGERGQLRAQLDGVHVAATVVASGEKRHVFVHGRVWALVSVNPLHHAGESVAAEASLLAPMPGKVIALCVDPGRDVAKGASLVILEAMKMEHTISAPASGLVKGFFCAVGDQVDEGAELVDFVARAARASN